MSLSPTYDNRYNTPAEPNLWQDGVAQWAGAASVEADLCRQLVQCGYEEAARAHSGYVDECQAKLRRLLANRDYLGIAAKAFVEFEAEAVERHVHSRALIAQGHHVAMVALKRFEA